MSKHKITHDGCLAVLIALTTDYKPWGTTEEGDPYLDCSMGCKHAAWLQGALGMDWCVCTRPDGPRKGLLTFEHQAGRGCFEQ